MVTRVPGSYKLARSVLRGRAWDAYLHWLMKREHKWNAPPRSVGLGELPSAFKPPPRKERIYKTPCMVCLKPVEGLFCDECRPDIEPMPPRSGRMTPEGKEAVKKSVQAAIENAKRLEAEAVERERQELAESYRRRNGIKSETRDGYTITYSDRP